MTINSYTKPITPGTDHRDVSKSLYEAAVGAGIQIAGLAFTDDSVIVSVEGELTPQQQTALTNLVITADPNAVWRVRETIEARALTALTANDTYLALASPTNAQNLAQIRALTRQVNGLIRIVLGQMSTTNGT